MTSQTSHGKTIPLVKTLQLSLLAPEMKAMASGQGIQMGRDVRVEGNLGAMLIRWTLLE